jgi:hypothetical protein
MSENAPVALPELDAATNRLIERMASSGALARTLGGSTATLIATGGQWIGGGWAIFAALVAPSVALLLPPGAQWMAIRAKDNNEDEYYEKMETHCKSRMQDPFLSVEYRDRAQKTLEKVHDAHLRRLEERASRKSKWLES